MSSSAMLPSPATSRRRFLTRSSLALGAVTMTDPLLSIARAKQAPLFKISLAQWTINAELKSAKVDNLDFAKVAHDHDIFGIEYVNQFFMDKAADEKYLAEMKQRAADHGVTSLILMCDHEGNLGDPDSAKRGQAVDNHRKWIDAAKFLGCHSIRVNAGSSGTYQEQIKLVTDGLARLTAIGAEQDINVLVENHGGLSSNADWLAEVITAVDHQRCGTLPDFGNFKVSDDQSYDSYRGIEKLMPWAKGVSVKDLVWDDNSKRSALDYERMFKIVLAADFHGYCGIEHGGYAGLNAAREKLEQVRERLTPG